MAVEVVTNKPVIMDDMPGNGKLLIADISVKLCITKTIGPL